MRVALACAGLIAVAAFAALALALPLHRLEVPRGGLTHISGNAPIVRGSGVAARQVRSVGVFNAVTADDGVNLAVSIGPRPSLEVEADDNLIGGVTTTLVGDRLKIGFRGSYATGQPPLVRLVTPTLSQVSLLSSSDATLDRLAGGDLRLMSSGSGSFLLTGRLQSAEIELAGSGGADLSESSIDDVVVTVNGSGKVIARAQRSLSATVNGSGSILYVPTAAAVSADVNGTGDIRALRPRG